MWAGGQGSALGGGPSGAQMRARRRQRRQGRRRELLPAGRRAVWRRGGGREAHRSRHCPSRCTLALCFMRTGPFVRACAKFCAHSGTERRASLRQSGCAAAGRAGSMAAASAAVPRAERCAALTFDFRWKDGVPAPGELLQRGGASIAHFVALGHRISIVCFPHCYQRRTDKSSMGWEG
jgi:hypothetical protein